MVIKFKDTLNFDFFLIFATQKKQKTITLNSTRNATEY